MTHFHRITQPKTRLHLAFLIGAVIVESCNPVAAVPTLIPTVQPSSAATAAPPPTPIPSLSLTPTEPPTATTEPVPEIFAGFTQDEEVPFLLAHRSGETLGSLSKGE